MAKVFSSLFVLFLCACSTPYQADGFRGGYSESRMGKDLYRVSFRGNGYTKHEDVKQGLLRRCAELTVEAGFEGFVMFDQDADVKSMTFGNTSETATLQRNYPGNYSYSSQGQFNAYNLKKHELSTFIKLFPEGSTPKEAFNAKEMLQYMTKN